MLVILALIAGRAVRRYDELMLILLPGQLRAFTLNWHGSVYEMSSFEAQLSLNACHRRLSRLRMPVARSMAALMALCLMRW